MFIISRFVQRSRGHWRSLARCWTLPISITKRFLDRTIGYVGFSQVGFTISRLPKRRCFPNPARPCPLACGCSTVGFFNATIFWASFSPTLVDVRHEISGEFFLRAIEIRTHIYTDSYTCTFLSPFLTRSVPREEYVIPTDGTGSRGYTP